MGCMDAAHAAECHLPAERVSLGSTADAALRHGYFESMTMAPFITLHELGLRDGLQSIVRILPTAHKLE